MSEIVFLIKFGERQFMERFANGHLYFSNALKFREIENNLMIKGQGDKLEGASKIYATDFKATSHESNDNVISGKNINLYANYAPANKLAVFCIMCCYENDCIRIDENIVRIKLRDDVVKDIKDHFPKADVGAVVLNPKRFITNVEDFFNGECKNGQVNYFNINGIASEGGIVGDMKYFEYLCQDVSPKKDGNKTSISFNAEYVYRSLQCKDIFFQKEQEYRFIVPTIEIDYPKEFDINLDTQIKLFDFDDFIKGVDINIK